MLVTFKDLQRVGVTRWRYRRVLESGALRPAKLKVIYTYPRFWSWDAEKAFGLESGLLASMSKRDGIRRAMEAMGGGGKKGARESMESRESRDSRDSKGLKASSLW